jgi:hypothetical protein
MVNIDPIGNSQQSISDDQELAKVLAGVDQEADAAADAGTGTVVPPVAPEPVSTLPAPSAVPEPEPLVAPELVSPLGDDLSSLKQEALSELRPLVDKLDVSPEEKFDTYLLLLRSTDDKSLIAPAHEAAKNIVDEARRAQALLDIIKEIDFLSAPK